MRLPSNESMVRLGQYPKACGLTNITCESKQLGSRQDNYLLAVMMPDSDATNARCYHAVGSDDDAVDAIECDDYSHPRKTLLALISG